jgi:hypothetical protein
MQALVAIMKDFPEIYLGPLEWPPLFTTPSLYFFKEKIDNFAIPGGFEPIFEVKGKIF